MTIGIFLLSFLFISNVSAESRWVTDFAECGTTYLSIDCEADQFVCGYDGILHCATPDTVSAGKSDVESTYNLNSGFPGGLVLDCVAPSGSCTPWQCQSDSSCDGQKRNTKCLKDGGFECGECSAGFFNCDATNPDCEVADGNIGNHASVSGCKGNQPNVVCKSGYLNCDGDNSNGCEIQIGGVCNVNGQVGTLEGTCNGNNPPSCSVFTQQFATVQTETGETVTSKLQVDDTGNINIPVGAKFMSGGVAIEGSDCSGNQVKVGTQCVAIPSCEFLKFNGSQFTCATPQKIDQTKLYPGHCGAGQMRIGETCQSVPNCDALRFDAVNGKFLCGKKASEKSQDATTAEVDEESVEKIIDKKFMMLANKLEGDFGSMLMAVQEQVAKGLETGKMEIITPDDLYSLSVDEGSKVEEKSWFSPIKGFFKGLFRK